MIWTRFASTNIATSERSSQDEKVAEYPFSAMLFCYRAAIDNIAFC